MEIIYLPFKAKPSPSVIALGYFDGGHIGHRALLAQTVACAKASGCVSAVFSFVSLSTKKGAPLSDLKSRLAFFEEAGIERVFLASFDAIRDLSASDFALQILKDECRAMYAVCGFNFRFGKGASGTGKELQELLPRSIVLPPTLYKDAPVSATRVREALLRGDLSDVYAMLGHPYTVHGKVSHGKALGKTLGFPTANIQPTTLLPRFGVYRTSLLIDGVCYNGLSDVGVRPTLEGEGVARIETFLPHFSGDLYEKELSVSFLSFLREEKKFDSIEALKAQINQDLKQIEA